MNADRNSESIKNVFIGFAVGFAAGAVTAMLLTTKTGEEMRAELRNAALDIKEQVEEKADKAKNLTKAKYEEIVSNAIKNYQKAKDFTQKEIDLIKEMLLEQNK